MTLWSSCAPKHVLWQPVFRSASEFKVRNLIPWTGHFAIYVRWLFGWRYISSLHSADELQQERNSCPLLRSCFIGSCHVGVSKRFSVVSALQSFAFKVHLSLTIYSKCVDAYLRVHFGPRSFLYDRAALGPYCNDLWPIWLAVALGQ